MRQLHTSLLGSNLLATKGLLLHCGGSPDMESRYVSKGIFEERQLRLIPPANKYETINRYDLHLVSNCVFKGLYFLAIRCD